MSIGLWVTRPRTVRIQLKGGTLYVTDVSVPGRRWWNGGLGHTSSDHARTDGSYAVRARSLDVCLDRDGPFIDVDPFPPPPPLLHGTLVSGRTLADIIVPEMND